MHQSCLCRNCCRNSGVYAQKCHSTRISMDIFNHWIVYYDRVCRDDICFKNNSVSGIVKQIKIRIGLTPPGKKGAAKKG